jgi:hypothetical protein
MRAFVLSMLCVATLGTVTANRTAAQEPASTCTFDISPAVTAPEIVGDNEAARRASVMAQPDSPLRILRVDLSGVDVKAGPGWFTRHGRHVLDVQNVSGQMIVEARVRVHVGFSSKGGVGSGHKLGRSLKPGEHARIEWSGGPGRGSIGSDAEVSVVALVEEVETADCTYRPSQAWPSRPAAQSVLSSTAPRPQ